MKKIKISVLMPVYNSENYLKDSIESILNQSFTDFEFIIIDDASKDKSWEIIKEYEKKNKNIVALQNILNIGTTKSLNKGLSIAKGKYVVRMDADDWSYPDRLKKQYNYMEKNLDVGVSGGTIEICDKNLTTLNVREYPLTDIAIRKIIFRFSPFAHSATIWNRKMMKGTGGYNENIPVSQDCELYFNVGKSSRFGNLRDKLIKLRMHKDSVSISKNFQQEKYAIFARVKAVMEYRYSIEFGDVLIMIGRVIAMFLVPKIIKFWIFNLLRRKK